ncbi:MAG: hypothetical protein NTX52_09940 [Planctomycetota bacterium]|nr:hypothetical protein [Planctomycetota bacterium]
MKAAYGYGTVVPDKSVVTAPVALRINAATAFAVVQDKTVVTELVAAMYVAMGFAAPPDKSVVAACAPPVAGSGIASLHY